MAIVSEEARGKAVAQTVERALALLDCFTVDAPEWTVAALAGETGLTHSTVYRLLQTLEVASLLERSSPAGTTYRLGLRTLSLAHVALAHNRLRQLTQPVLTEIVSETGLMASVGCLYRGGVLYLARTTPRPDPRAALAVGRQAPIYCTALGKAMLAFLPVAEADAILQAASLKAFSPSTLTTVEALQRDLEETRQRGYAVERGEWVQQNWCVAAPLQGRGGAVAGAISVTGPARELAEGRVDQLGQLVFEHASRTSYDLGNSRTYS